MEKHQSLVFIYILNVLRLMNSKKLKNLQMAVQLKLMKNKKITNLVIIINFALREKEINLANLFILFKKGYFDHLR